jgi:hypothetical protein
MTYPFNSPWAPPEPPPEPSKSFPWRWVTTVLLVGLALAVVFVATQDDDASDVSTPPASTVSNIERETMADIAEIDAAWESFGTAQLNSVCEWYWLQLNNLPSTFRGVLVGEYEATGNDLTPGAEDYLVITYDRWCG